MNAHVVGSVTGWIEDLKNKDPDAQRKIVKRFSDRLIRCANQWLRGSGCRITDGDDIANMALFNFFEKDPNQFEQLLNRNDLWKLLLVMAERRAIDQIRKETSQKSGGKRLVSESVIRGIGDGPNGADNIANPFAQPDYELMLIEEAETRLNSLPSNVLRRVALERMYGYRNAEIAKRMKLSLRSVERKLREIRDIFKTSVESSKLTGSHE